MANTFIRKWALMTEQQKKARGLEWIVDLVVQLPDNCTVPKYIDADNVVPRSVHLGINEDRASSVPAPQVHFALVYFGVAPEFSETVEAQEAHAGMFDLSARVRSAEARSRRSSDATSDPDSNRIWVYRTRNLNDLT